MNNKNLVMITESQIDDKDHGTVLIETKLTKDQMESFLKQTGWTWCDIFAVRPDELQYYLIDDRVYFDENEDQNIVDRYLQLA